MTLRKTLSTSNAAKTRNLRKRHLGVATLLSGGLLTALSISAQAQTSSSDINQMMQQGKSEWSQTLQKADKNGDKQLSKEEMAAQSPQMAAYFDSMDTNKDGYVTTKEGSAYWASVQKDKLQGKIKSPMKLKDQTAVKENTAALKARWEEADSNHDSMLSKEEAKDSFPVLSQHFDQLDTNQDGQLSSKELRNFIKS
ncbi:hypothetical protein ACKC9G_12150 [Pokkaliibacter sp. CJK22405]|uniref:hypothetical protein n=1 Tax=Pokkaliibacter sp. CJK22405 TaxID=3384615 RepID=UPI003985354C